MIKLAFHFEDDVPTEILMAHPEVDAVDHGTRCCAFSVAVFAVIYGCLLPCRRLEDVLRKYVE